MRYLNTFMTAVAVMISLTIMLFITLPMPEPMSAIHPAPDVLVASLMADVNAQNPYDHWSTLREANGRHKPNVMRAIMGMGGISLQGPGATSNKPYLQAVCFVNSLPCIETNGQVIISYVGSVLDFYVGGGNRMTISNSTGNMVLTPGTGGIAVNGTASTTINPNVDGNYVYWQGSLRVNGGNGLVVDGNIQVLAGNLLARNASFTQFSVGTVGNAYFNVDTNGIANTMFGTVNNQPIVGGLISSNTTAVGNLGASGPDDLQVGSLAASSLVTATNNRCVRVTAVGTTANNANAKTVRLVAGAGPTALCTKQLTASIAGTWMMEAVICRTGASAQRYYAYCEQSGGTTVSTTDGTGVWRIPTVTGTLTETETNAMTIKTQSTVSTSDNDVVSNELRIEAI